MKVVLKRPVFDRDEYYDSAARTVRWIILVLCLISFPFDSTPTSVAVLTMIVFASAYNAMGYIGKFRDSPVFSSRPNTLAVDHIFVLGLVGLSGGLASPYYPLFYLLIIGTIASYGIAGFAFSLSSQVVITLVLLHIDLTASPNTPELQFVIKLVILIVFSLVAEQSVRSRDDESLLEGRFTKRIENERARLLSLINSMSSAVLAITDKGEVYLYNAAALEILNTNKSINGENINALLPLHDKRGHKVNLFNLISKEDHSLSRQDLSYTAEDGSKMSLDLTVTPVHIFAYPGSGNWGGYMAVFRDITKQKSLDEERDEFISVTSHELRTPLAIAEANLSTALLPGYAKIDAKAKPLLEQAHENMAFMGELIQDLGTLARAERGDLKLQVEMVDAATLAKELASDYAPQAEAKKLTLKLDLGPGLGQMVTSAAELREILQNFLTNALKYTATGGIVIEVRAVEGGTQFSVKDTGIGLSASDKTKIFEKFYRSEDYRTRQTGGTGLGLYITHKLAEKLGITITFTSRLNHGSTFTVLVPVHDDDAAVLAQSAAVKA